MRLPYLAAALVLPLLMLAGCTERHANKPQVQLTERVAMLMGGWPHAKAITETGKATAFRIKSNGNPSEENVISEGIELTDQQRATLVGLLADETSYAWEIGKGCIPMPGVLVTFEDGGTFARLRICYSCKMLGYKPGSWEDFDPVEAELIEWAKDVFPDDKLIQGLSVESGASGL